MVHYTYIDRTNGVGPLLRKRVRSEFEKARLETDPEQVSHCTVVNVSECYTLGFRMFIYHIIPASFIDVSSRPEENLRKGTPCRFVQSIGWLIWYYRAGGILDSTRRDTIR